MRQISNRTKLSIHIYLKVEFKHNKYSRVRLSNKLHFGVLENGHRLSFANNLINIEKGVNTHLFDCKKIVVVLYRVSLEYHHTNSFHIKHLKQMQFETRITTIASELKFVVVAEYIMIMDRRGCGLFNMSVGKIALSRYVVLLLFFFFC